MKNFVFFTIQRMHTSKFFQFTQYTQASFRHVHISIDSKTVSFFLQEFGTSTKKYVTKFVK